MHMFNRLPELAFVDYVGYTKVAAALEAYSMSTARERSQDDAEKGTPTIVSLPLNSFHSRNLLVRSTCRSPCREWTIAQRHSR
jgi:hypothetical protein